MAQHSSSRINNYRKKLTTYYLSPGKQQAKKLDIIQPKELSHPDTNGLVLVRLTSGIEVHMSQEEFLSRPEVFIQTIVDDYWHLFELALSQLHSPTVVLTLRTLYEQCYKKILYYSNATAATQKNIAIKSWAITHALMVRRASDLSFFDSSQDLQFQKWVSLLPEPDKTHYMRIKSENYSSGAVVKEINKIYPGLYNVVTRYSAELVLADGNPSNNPDGLVLISNHLSGYVHGNSANVTDMMHDLSGKQHVYRSRAILCSTAFQVMTIINKNWLAANPQPLNSQITYFKRMTPHILRRLGRSDAAL